MLESTNEITEIIEDLALRKFNLRPIPLGRHYVYFHRFYFDDVKGHCYLFLAWIYGSVISVTKERVSFLNEF